MTQLIPFENAALPAHFSANPDALALNAVAEEFASIKFPVISIKANRFQIKKPDDTKVVVMRPKSNPSDPDEPATYLDLVVLNLQKAKSYYSTGYTEGSAEAPDCFSSDGVVPHTLSKAKQCNTCALCPHNAWGSGTNDKGEATKGKACSDVLRLAVASPADLKTPMLLRVPPASLKNFANASRIATSRGIPLNGVLIRTSFQIDTNGILEFKPVAMLDASTYQSAVKMMNSDIVLAITGKSDAGVPVAAVHAQVGKEVSAPAQVSAPVGTAEAVPAAETKVKANTKAKSKAAKVAAANAEEAEDDEGDKEPASVSVATSDSFADELAALLK